MLKKSSEGKKEKIIPETFDGIQVNCCNNPLCINYGVDPHYNNIIKKRKSSSSVYKVQASGKNSPVIFCDQCLSRVPIKSNKSLSEEFNRINKFRVVAKTCCPTIDCPNNNIDIANSDSYRFYGKTAAGSQRYQCLSCKKVFSKPNKRRKQRVSHKNRTIFKAIVAQVPVQGILEIAEINPETFYNRVGWIYEKVQEFMGERELKFSETGCDRLYLSCDRQVQTVNWPERKDRRIIQLYGLATVDNRSRYVFGWDFNVDHDISQEAILNDPILELEKDKRPQHRKYARLWLPDEFKQQETEFLEKALHEKDPNPLKLDVDSPEYQIWLTEYKHSIQLNLDAIDEPNGDVRLPKQGMLVHSDYSTYAHFLANKEMFKSVEKVRFFVDREPSIRNAINIIFNDRITARTADGWFVANGKNISVNQRTYMIKQFERQMQLKTGIAWKDLDNTSKYQLIQELYRHEIENQIPIENGSRKTWVRCPIPTMYEPQKMVRMFTDLGDYSEEHMINLYHKASLHGVEGFFKVARDKIRMFSRDSTSASTNNKWYGFSPYRVDMISKLSGIFRFYHNYMKRRGEQHEVPAVKLGLAKAPIKIESLLY
ncbi:hypothetical protein [Thalassotalea aquiviva]|uniref:hypothetical protein n=1 Tax=Thalassotalea aquiviva TaxID=3242415 RepID=UPI00352B7E60